MKDEISFRSLIVKTSGDIHEQSQKDKNTINQIEENQESIDSFFLSKQKSSTSNVSNNNNNSITNNSITNNSITNMQNKNDSKKSKVKIKVKEYFNKNKQLNKKDFNSFLSFIGLSDIWSSEVEQMILWESIIKNAKNKDNIDYDATLLGINELFEEDEDEDDDDYDEINDEINDKKSNGSEKINNSYLDVSTNENCIDEYLNTIKDNINLLFAIKFINEIFLKKLTNNNVHYSINTINTLNVNNSIGNDDLDNKSDADGENEVIQIDNKIEKKSIIYIKDIMNEIKNKYRFILINNEELNNYFNNLNKNLRKSNYSNNVIVKNEKEQEFYLDKELINYISAMIELKLGTKIKNEENKMDFNENEEINNTNNTNNITNDNSKDITDNNNNINENSKMEKKEKKKEINYQQIIGEFNTIDNMISDCYEAIIIFNKNKDLINFIKLFNDYYIMNKKKIIYDKIIKLVVENTYLSKEKQKKEDDEIMHLKQQNESLKERNEYLKKENAELKENLTKNFNDIMSKKTKRKISKLNLQNLSNQNNQNNYFSSISPRHMRNKTSGDANLLVNNIVNQNNLKNNNNQIVTNQTKNEEEKKNNISNNSIVNNNNNINHNNIIINNNNINSNKSNNLLQFTKTGTNSFLDYNLENSHSELFSIIGNTTINDNKFLFETTELPIEQNGENQGTPTLTPRSLFLDTKDISNNSYLNMNTSNSGISDIINDSSINVGKVNECKINIGKNINTENNKNVNEKNNKINDNKRENKSKNNVDNYINNKFSFTINKLNGLKNNINNNKSDKMHYYDFKYISSNKIIGKLLLQNNEKIKSGEIFSSQVYFILNGNKKRKGILLITSECFYVLDDSNDMNCIIRICHNLLSSISLPQENFNHLLLSFSDDTYIIIEIYQRIYLLNYLKELYFINKYRKLNINFCQSFNIKARNNQSYLYDLKTNKDIILTPNFEGAQKLGFLLKYKENFFSAYFTEKLIALCSIGLVVFSKSNINVPKLIIPIIGATIRFTSANANEKLFCFKIKAVNNETFIFGSTKKNEINDWMQELRDYQKFYETKMNELFTDCIIVNQKNKNN